METLDYEETPEDHRRQIFDLTTMLDIGRTVNSTLSLNDISDIIKLTCSGHFHASEVKLLLPSERNGQYFFNYPPDTEEMVFDSNHPLLQLFKDNQRAIDIDELKHRAALKDVYRRLQGDSVELIVPLRSKFEINGILCLASKEQTFGERYTARERRYMDIIASFASVAIENARLYEIATLDRKTGLFNHGHFQNRLVEEIERAERYKSDLSLMMLDLDHFKQVNDTHGHVVGDEVLKKVARTLREQIRSFDIPARFGGEEFMVILPETDGQSSLIVAERLRKAVEKLSFDSAKKRFSISVSIGVANFVHETSLTDDLFIDRADRALYHAKETGRNRVVCYEAIAEKAKSSH
jgi:diguanylate cyclase (GGDEF)-like protein